MKRIFILFLLLTVILVFTSCASGKGTELSIMRYDNSNPPHLIWNNKSYDFYGFVDDNKTIGKQIGTIEKESHSRVFEVTGQSTKNWLIVTDTDEMSVYSLYKQDAVTDVPSNLEKFKK